VLSNISPPDDPDAELHVLARQHAGLVHQRRMEHLAKLLDDGRELAVCDSASGFCGDRLTLWVGNGTVMRLKLLHPRRDSYAAILQIRWCDGAGWVIDLRSTNGDDVTCYAWDASVTSANWLD
jgi:hypothetical protein